jgi:DnaK suppressor protein
VTRTFAPATVRRIERRLYEARDDALARAAALRAGARSVFDDLDRSGLLDEDGHDGFTAGFEHGVMLRLAADAERAAADAEQALRQLHSGSYGICRSCRLPIPVTHLEAVPTTDRCVSCATGGRLVQEAAA